MSPTPPPSTPDNDQPDTAPVSEEERHARFCLAHVVEPGDPATARDILLHGPVAVWDQISAPGSTSRWAQRAAVFDPAAAQRRTAAIGARFLVPGDPDWPTGLDDLEHCEEVQHRAGVPLGLWVRGDLTHLRQPRQAVSIVGARSATVYGETVAVDLAAGLVARGIAVVSGGAYGIDIAAHRGALAATHSGQASAPTVAVLAGGLDQLYPAGNTTTLQQVAHYGAVVSELPPGQRPSRLRFLSRNRMIAAISGATVVVQAHIRSGARNTATWAGRCARPLLAVPGPITEAASHTPHLLVRTREAELVTNVEEIVEVLAPMGQDMLVDATAPATVVDRLADTEREVFEALPARAAIGLEELALAAAVPAGVCAAMLESLAARGLVEPAGHGRWRLTGTHL